MVPVPKSSRPKLLNDFRPVALTSVVMKVFEKIIRNVVMVEIEHQLDPMQSAYRPNRGVEDARLTLLNLILKHVESKWTLLQFIDFSSAFNTIQPHILIKRLLEQFEIRENLVGWILDFLTDRSQTE